MAGRGKHERTQEMREAARQRSKAIRDAGQGAKPCGASCECGKHKVTIGRKWRKCKPGCTCKKHNRTIDHNMAIGDSVAYTAKLKREAKGIY